MSSMQLEILVIASLTSIAAVLPGIFLVLRGVALMSDAISHAILLGIAVMFLIVQKLTSPLLLIGASLAGLIMVVCTEVLIKTCRLKKDAAIGLVFPLFFSIGVILISQYARNVHLDMDMVLLGELVFAPFNRLIINGVDLGPYALWIMGIISILNLVCTKLFYKELQLVTFDNDFAYILGISPTLVYYGLMTMTSITAVGAFDVVGAIVVVALMITPPSTAYLLTGRLSHMIGLSLLIGLLSAQGGYLLAMLADVSIAGSIATVSGIFFILAFLCAPQKGVFAHLFVTRTKRQVLAHDVLCSHLFLSHKSASHVLYHDQNAIKQQLGWDTAFLYKMTNYAIAQGHIIQNQGVIALTDAGVKYAQKVLHNVKNSVSATL